MNTIIEQKRRISFWELWDAAGIYMFLGVVFIVFAILTPDLLKINNIRNLFSQAAVAAIAAAGMTFAITSGGFDLSVGSTMSVVSCLIVIFTKTFAENVPEMSAGLRMAIVLAIVMAVSVVLGIINGLIITKLKIQTFIATLATMVIFRGFALIITRGKIISISAHHEFKVFAVGWAPAVMIAVVFIFAFLLYKYTKFGVGVRAVGSNISAARISGLAVDKTMILVFIMTSVTASISGILMTSQLMMGSGSLASGAELDVIAPTILGGTALAGGKGNVWGTAAAAILLALISNGLDLLGTPESYQKLINGLILVFALALGGFRELSRRKEVRR